MKYLLNYIFLLVVWEMVIYVAESGFCNNIRKNRGKNKIENDTKEEKNCDVGTRKYEDLTDERNCFPNFFQENIPSPTIDSISRKQIMPLNSACLTCGLCIVIAEKLTQAFSNHSKVMMETKIKRMIYPDLILVCACSFQKYALLQSNGKQYFGPSQPYSKQVSTAEPNPWPEVLEDMCIIFMNIYGEMNIYDDWIANPLTNLTDLLCRGEGVFASCRNMFEEGTEISQPSTDKYLKCNITN